MHVPCASAAGPASATASSWGPPVARRVAYRYGGQIKASESRRPLPPCGDRRLVPLGRAAGRDLHAPPDPVQQHIKPGQRVIHPEPLAHQLADPGQRPALNPPSPRRPDPRPSPPPARATGPGSTCTGPRPPPLEASACFPPTASARRHRFADIRDTRNRLATPGRSRRPRSAPPLPAAPVPANPLLRGQPAAIQVPHGSGIAHDAPPLPEPITPRS